MFRNTLNCSRDRHAPVSMSAGTMIPRIDTWTRGLVGTGPTAGNRFPETISKIWCSAAAVVAVAVDFSVVVGVAANAAVVAAEVAVGIVADVAVVVAANAAGALEVCTVLLNFPSAGAVGVPHSHDQNDPGDGTRSRRWGHLVV